MYNQSQVEGIRKICRVALTTVIAVILTVAVFATTAFAGLLSEYNVTVVDNGVSTVITTNETAPIEILNQANITLNDDDKLDISGFEAGNGGTIVISRQSTINVEYGGVIQTYSVWAPTVASALTEAGIAVKPDDKLNFALTDSVADGMVISIKAAFNVVLNADGASTEFKMNEGTVADLLALAQVTLDADDYTQPALETALIPGMAVNVNRVEIKEETKSESIPYETVATSSSKLEKGKTEVISNGVDGKQEIKYSVKYVNGKKVETKEVSRTVVKAAVSKQVLVGTKQPKSNGVKSKNGYKVGQKIKGRYTHYCACGKCGSGRGVTASGKKVRNGMKNPHYIACNWLPLGSVVSVNGVNYTVVDRGGSGLSSKGRIDIFTPEGHQACFKYGTGSCELEIVRLGW